MTGEQLEAIRQRARAATQGPWRWFGYQNSQQVELEAMGGRSVMSFARWGMQSAQPLFYKHDVSCSIAETAAPDSAPERKRITAMAHPDGNFIASARQDVDDLLEEVDRLRGELASRDESGAALVTLLEALSNVPYELRPASVHRAIEKAHLALGISP